MKKFLPFVLTLGLGGVFTLTGCLSQTQLQALASDEAKAATYLNQLSTLAGTKSSAATLTAANDKMLAIDPSSTVLQKIHSAVAQAIAAGDLKQIQQLAASGATLLNGVAAVTSKL